MKGSAVGRGPRRLAAATCQTADAEQKGRVHRTTVWPLDVRAALSRPDTHRVGLSGQRLVTDDGLTVRTHGSATVTLAPLEVMQRFLRHVLPSGCSRSAMWGCALRRTCGGELARAHELLGPGDRGKQGAAQPEPTSAEPEPPERWSELLGRMLVEETRRAVGRRRRRGCDL